MDQRITEAQIDAGGINTHYLYGGQGAPILFLHGVPSSSYLWRNVMAPLANDFSVFAPDLPGFAKTESPPEYGLMDCSAWLTDFHKAVCENQKINLVVHDAGGPIGLHFTLEHPEIVSRLIVMDTLISEKNRSITMRLVMSPPALWAYYHLLNKGLFGSLMRSSVHQKNKLASDALEEYYKVFRRDKRDRTSAKLLEKIRLEIDDLVGNRLHTIDCPTLVLWAEKDSFLTLTVAEGIQGQIKGATLKTLPDCGHFSQEEEPELIARHTKDFCAPNSLL